MSNFFQFPHTNPIVLTAANYHMQICLTEECIDKSGALLNGNALRILGPILGSPRHSQRSKQHSKEIEKNIMKNQWPYWVKRWP